MQQETCAKCGFDGAQWTDGTAVDAIGRLPDQWAKAVAGLPPGAAQRRPRVEMWSIAEYVDHVREVLFAMRFLLESSIENPGLDLGPSPEPEFTPAPRAIDMPVALAGLDREARALEERLAELTPTEWSATAKIGANVVDPHWIARHAVHDATHHLQDVDDLRCALKRTAGHGLSWWK